MIFSLIVCTLGTRLDEMKRLIQSLEEQVFKDFELVVISQDNHDAISFLLSETNLNVIHKRIEKKGLSHARNVGLKITQGDYISISDDDCWYPKEALDGVFKQIRTYKEEYDAFCFQIFDPINNRSYKSYPIENKKLNKFSIGRVSSIEIFFHKEARCSFDENFGLGARFPSGEENIYLSDILKSGMNIIFIPLYIVYHLSKRTEKKFTYIEMLTKLHVYQRMYNSYIGLIIYYYFYIKHFGRVQDKIKSLLPTIIN